MKNMIFGCTLLLLFTLSACSGGETPPEEMGQGLRELTLILDYVPNTNHTGFYVAQEKGYFREEGLDVKMIEPADVSVSTLIAGGKGDFGISFQEDVIYAKNASDPLPIKAIAAIIQHNTSGFASYAEKNITRPAEFEGKVYAGWGSLSEETVIEAVMAADGGDFSTLTVVTADESGPASLLDRVDIIWLFWAWDGIAAQLAGIPLHYMELRDLDPRLDYYTPLIIASEDMLADEADLTKRFLRAVTRGYEFCIAEPEAAASILHAQVPEYDLDMLIASQRYLAEKYAEDAPAWGYMKSQVWSDYTAFMLEHGLIETDIAPEACYSNAFLP